MICVKPAYRKNIKKCKITGKKIIPFATAASNGRDSSLATVKELFKGCEVSNYFYTTKPKNGEVDTWINSLQVIDLTQQHE